MAQLVDAPVNLRRGRFVAGHPDTHRLQPGQLLTVAAVDVVALQVTGEVVQPGEGGGEDDAGVVAHRLR